MADTYAIIESGGKQYRAEKGGTLVVDRLRADEGAKVDLRAVMFRGDKDVLVGGSDLEKVKVEATVTGHERGEKIRVFKYRAKKGYRKRAGHRSELTRLEVTEVKLLTRKPARRRRPKSSGRPRRTSPRQRTRQRRRSRRRRPRSPPRASPPRRRSQLPRSPPRASPRQRRLTTRRARDDGSQEGARLEPQRPRFEPEDARREDLRRPAGRRRRDPRPPARHAVPPGDGAGLGRDHTIFATRAGTVEFAAARKGRIVSVVESE